MEQLARATSSEIEGVGLVSAPKTFKMSCIKQNFSGLERGLESR